VWARKHTSKPVFVKTLEEETLGEDVPVCSITERGRGRASGLRCLSRANNGALFLVISFT
jgi:hypothetical protein